MQLRADRAGFWSAGHSAETPAGISAGQDLNEFGRPRISAAGQLRRPALYTTVGTERHAGFEAYRDVASLRRRLRALCEDARSEEHTSELQSLRHLVCR